MKRDILAVDDDELTLDLIRRILKPLAAQLVTVTNGADAVALLEQRSFDLLITDLEMPVMDGSALLGRARAIAPEMPVLVVTGHAERLDDAVGAIRQGAYHYLVKPFHPDVLRLIVRQALDHSRAVRAREHFAAVAAPSRDAGYGALVGTSPGMRRVFGLIDKVAARDSTVLLLGETGTGKELVAREIHRRSPRHDQPFVAVNCAALPENLLEAELFGYERGAFSGAVSAKPGRLEVADDGTALLDEIGAMPLPLQAKLLRFLAEREFEHLGSVRTRRVDVRIIAATNVDLAELVSAGRFRSDLYYRVNVFPIELPPLRTRREDVLPLARHILARLAPAGIRRELTPRAEARLTAYHWPGNVRELENVLERALIVAGKDRIDADDLCLGEPGVVAEHPSGVPAGVSLGELEKQAIIANLRAHKNRRKVARLLGISPTTLYQKMKNLKLQP